MVGSCGAARECCFPCEGGSRKQVLQGGGGLMTVVETIVIGQGNVVAQNGIPDLNSSSSCWDWDSPRQWEGARMGAGMAEECAG